jgi:hypothetical protein
LVKLSFADVFLSNCLGFTFFSLVVKFASEGHYITFRTYSVAF